MKIQVRQEHIKDGLRGSCIYCPIALAMADAGLLQVYVGNFVIDYDTPEHKNFGIATPTQVQEFIDNFDKGLKVQPFEFEVPNG